MELQSIAHDPGVDDAALTYFRQRCGGLLGLDLGSYKQEQIRRRLSGLMHTVGVANVVELARVLADDEAKLARFRHSFTIHVTEFFRDPAAFGQIESTGLPALRALGRPVDVWSAACSLGAEPLSLAMLLRDARIPCRRLLATDVCETTIAKALVGGPFDPREVKNLTESRLQQHLTRRPDGYWVTSPLHHQIEFRIHDLIADPYESGFDLVVCRNVLIYFAEGTKEAVLARLTASVRPGGFLFLGGTEIVRDPARLGLRLARPSLYQRLPS